MSSGCEGQGKSAGKNAVLKKNRKKYYGTEKQDSDFCNRKENKQVLPENELKNITCFFCITITGLPKILPSLPDTP